MTAAEGEPLPTRGEAIADAGTWLADRLDALDAMSPREVAERRAAGDPTVDVDALEDRVRAARGLEPRTRGAA